jgi:uncharacterized membrane protein (DUF485 family)
MREGKYPDGIARFSPTFMEIAVKTQTVKYNLCLGVGISILGFIYTMF